MSNTRQMPGCAGNSAQIMIWVVLHPDLERGVLGEGEPLQHCFTKIFYT